MDTARTTAVQIASLDDGRRLQLGEGKRQQIFSALWLRENAPDSETLDPTTGQRLIEAAELPLDLRIERLSINNRTLQLAFSDRHTTEMPIADLLATPRAAHREQQRWSGDLQPPAATAFDAAVDDDRSLSTLLEQLSVYGFARVSGVPVEEDGMQPLLDRIGPIRRTNWGGIADVKSTANAYDLTMTRRGLEPHTDNPYREPIPGYIWLHCLRNAAAGGDSTLVDGFRAAELLRERYPEAYRCLTRTPVRFRYRDASSWLENEGFLIEENAHGQVWRVRYNNRTEHLPALEPEVLERYYAARQRFHALITSTELTLHLRLEPGELLIMDNYRLLHGRTAFILEGGERHLRQGYVDRDTTLSRYHLLKQAQSTAAAVTGAIS
ncbi:2-trimethylaminoethylphosphonate dioxygenase [Kushneria aurantia]|uniref:TauD/TfdA family dioxygenase n=1 Tax=Kushneria aurantia TaxID=504092 RepID=A0ABV6G0A2_9GAMM|nr:TauD/TfdA family dioxygenase [Kushneria aurantia]